MATPDALSVIARLVAHVEGETVPGDLLADGRALLKWLSERSVEVLEEIARQPAHPPGEIPNVRAEVISAAALTTTEIEVLVVTGTRHQAFTIGPVAARSLMVLLGEAIHELQAQAP